MSYGYRTQVVPGWPPRSVSTDDRFFQLVREMAVAMADRRQDGLLDDEAFGKAVVAAAGSVMLEFLYATGERKRPMSAEEWRAKIDLLEKMSKK